MEAEPWCYQFMLTGHGVPGLIYKLRHLRKSFPGASVSASVKWEIKSHIYLIDNVCSNSTLLVVGGGWLQPEVTDVSC